MLLVLDYNIQIVGYNAASSVPSQSNCSYFYHVSNKQIHVNVISLLSKHE